VVITWTGRCAISRRNVHSWLIRDILGAMSVDSLGFDSESTKVSVSDMLDNEEEVRRCENSLIDSIGDVADGRDSLKNMAQNMMPTSVHAVVTRQAFVN